jgi:hypothetical protein
MIQMVKKLTKKFKDIKVEITFAEPQEYDIKREVDAGEKDAFKKRLKSIKKKQTTRKAKAKK